MTQPSSAPAEAPSAIPGASPFGSRVESVTIICVIPGEEFPAQDLAITLGTMTFTLAFVPFDEFIRTQASLILPDGFPVTMSAYLNRHTTLAESGIAAQEMPVMSRIAGEIEGGTVGLQRVLICAGPSMIDHIMQELAREAPVLDATILATIRPPKFASGDVIDLGFGVDGLNRAHCIPR